jgi:hypothetical protein
MAFEELGAWPSQIGTSAEATLSIRAIGTLSSCGEQNALNQRLYAHTAAGDGFPRHSPRLGFYFCHEHHNRAFRVATLSAVPGGQFRLSPRGIRAGHFR